MGDTSPPKGSEPGYRRPVLVVQGDEFNASKINTVVVIALTSNMALQAAPGNALLSKRSHTTAQGLCCERLTDHDARQVVPDRTRCEDQPVCDVRC